MSEVTVPGPLVRRVLAALVRDLTDQVRRNGGSVTLEYSAFLAQLHDAVGRQQRSASGSDPAVLDTIKAGTGMPTSTAAGLLGCSERHARELARAGRIAAQRVGRDWLIESPIRWQERDAA